MPVKIHTKENNDNSVYNHLNTWNTLIQNQTNYTENIARNNWLNTYTNRLSNDSVISNQYLVPIQELPKKTLFQKIKSFFQSIYQRLKKKNTKVDTVTFDQIAFPIVTRMATQTIGLDLVSVQPMEQPTGMLMYLDFKYKTEHENAFTKAVLFEKHKAPKPFVYSASTNLEDYFLTVRG